jgi:hypothetical protein
VDMGCIYTTRLEGNDCHADVETRGVRVGSEIL